LCTTAAAQLARLRTRFPEWDIIRTRCGTFLARHRITGERVIAHTLAELETHLMEWGMRR
jgi:hypothetical protein